MKLKVSVIDDACHNPIEIRQQALMANYEAVTVDGDATYTGVAICEIPEIIEAVRKIHPGVACRGTAFRINHSNELPNNWVHADVGYGSVAVVLYLSLPDDCVGGTMFWRHRPTGCDILPDEGSELREPVIRDWLRPDVWDPLRMIDMKFGRLLAYPTQALHSRYPREAFGNSLNNGRLIGIGFFG